MALQYWVALKLPPIYDIIIIVNVCAFQLLLFPGSVPGSGRCVSSKVLDQIQEQGIRGQVHLIRAFGNDVRDFARRVDPPQLDEPGVIRNGLTNQLRRPSLSLRSNDGGPLVLQGLLDDKAGALGVLRARAHTRDW